MSGEPGTADPTARCPHCTQRFAVAPEHFGRRVRCPECGQAFRLQPDAQPTKVNGLCAVCRSPIGPDELATTCPECQAPFHRECWDYNGGCAVYGCSRVPPTERLDNLEIPASYWGQREKQCPACSQTIQAAAVRCRHCGAMFTSARPEDSSEFHRRTTRQRNLPAVRRAGVWWLIFSLMFFAAPIVAVFGSLWYSRHREEIEALPTVSAAVCKIAVAVGIGQTALIALVVVLFALFN